MLNSEILRNNLGVWADLILIVAGMYGLIILIENWKLIEK